MTSNDTKKASFKSLGRKVRRIMIYVVSGLLVCILILAGVLLALSPGKPIPFVDENGNPVPGSISEKIWIDVNGVQEGMFIKSKNASNPVLLFLHGGTGMPEYFITRDYPTGLENLFTVVWWERRGTGLSYGPSIPPETMTIEQMIADTLAVTNYLRQRFHQDKIYLMAHSGGSIIAIQAAARAPELYNAYIAIGQMAYQLKSENLAYAYMLEQFKRNGDTRWVQRLEAGPVTMAIPLPDSYMALRDDAMHSLGIGTTHDMKSVITGVFLASWLNPEYTMGEKLNIWRGKKFSDNLLWNTILAIDLTKQVTELKLPVYFFHGIDDYTVNYAETKVYFEQLKAPVKGFYTFNQSAHSPIMEEPAKSLQILQEDVLHGTNNLADIK
jgi:pimeloyl-ACP methyl ester carboxylesterase